MAVDVPEWLTKHDGNLKLTSDGRTWLVLIGTQAQYKVVPVPVGGKFGCNVVQTINGKAVATKTVADTGDAAIRGALEELRQALGW
jgi:hypothetical protein